jgi:DNA-binding NtrC family response regulator
MFFTRDGVEQARLEPDKPLVVGRGEEADLRIHEPKLSHLHAQFTLREKGVLVEDLGSLNGVWRGDQRLSSTQLVPGDEIMLATVPVQVFALGMAPELNLIGETTFRGRLEEELRRARYAGRRLAVLAVCPGDKELTEAPHGTWATHLRQQLAGIDRVFLYRTNIALIMLLERDVAEAQMVARSIAAGGPPAIGPRSVGMALHGRDATTADKLMDIARQNLKRARPGEPALEAPAESEDGEKEPPIFGASMKDALEIVRQAARVRYPVLILGETGTGKEVLARRLHETGPRAEQRFHAVNCGAIPENLIASELFGHEKGAFTGADKKHLGAFRAADKGTLFLDEIGDLPLDAQKALLRALNEQTITPVGSTEEIKVDVRVVAATHRDLQAMIEEGSFREDLHYRLSTLVVEIPPLRERKDEIEPLAERFLRRANAENNLSVRGFSSEALALLRAHRWPGNVRELKNAVERAAVMAEGEMIQPEDLPKAVREALPEPGRAPDTGLKADLTRAEKQRIEEALRETGGNQTKAAKKLGMPRRTLSSKIERLGLEPSKKPPKK